MLANMIEKLPFQTHMDFQGQKLAEKVFQLIIVVCAAIGFIWGYIEQYFSYTIYTTLVGFCIASLATLPPWPFYRRNPLKWQKPIERPVEDEKKETSPQKPKKKK